MKSKTQRINIGFNTQPPEGGCKAGERGDSGSFSFNTQPPEGGWAISDLADFIYMVSTHSRPKAAGLLAPTTRSPKRFNTQPPEGGCPERGLSWQHNLFQHTAARRRLLVCQRQTSGGRVSTHSRPKAAAHLRQILFF